MPLLSELTNEIDRLTNMGRNPAFIMASDETMSALKAEVRSTLFIDPDDSTPVKILGLGVMKNPYLPVGVFRVMVEFHSSDKRTIVKSAFPVVE